MTKEETLKPGKSARDIQRSVVGRAYEVICDRIASGEFGANERLTEARLVKEVGVGRGAIREAMNKLAADGLIKLIPNKGALVRTNSRKDLADFFQVRGLFESFAASRAAERIDEAGSRELIMELLEEVENLELSLDLEVFIQHDASFHAGLMELSGNEIMSAEWRRLRRSRFRTSFLKSLAKEEISRSLKEHKEILMAIITGDAKTASDLGWQHVKLTSGRVQSMSNKQFDTVFNPTS